MKTQGDILDQIVTIMDNHINNKNNSTAPAYKHLALAMVVNKIQTLLEEEYIHGSLDNDYK